MFSGADVYSYGEGDMVLDPLLAEHLSHFGKALIQDRVLKNCFPYKIYNYLPLTLFSTSILDPGVGSATRS